MNKIVEMIFGSHLYGTNSPTSDMDVKGVYLPTHREILLSKFPKSINQSTKKDSSQKNTAADTDVEFYSLHYFFDLACEGETVALDMLHAPASAWLHATPTWSALVSQRHLFYTKNLKSLVGYARRQAAKYGVKGSRLHEAKMVLDVLQSVGSYDKVSDVLARLPVGEHVGPVEKDGAAFYGVCGRYLTLNARCEHYVPMVEAFIREYGDRARQAEANEGIDWKAVSHAFRAAYQTRAIFRDGGFTYPLPETEYIKAVKCGKLHFKNEVAPVLDTLMDEVEALSKASTYPDRVDREKVNNLLVTFLTDFP